MIGCLLINPEFDFSSNKHDDKIVAHDYRQLGLCNHLDKNNRYCIIFMCIYQILRFIYSFIAKKGQK